MPATKSFQKHIQFLRNDIEKAIHQIPLDKSPTYFYDPIKYVLNGKGKRLRPILVHLTGQVYSSDPEGLMKAAIAVELLHNFSLVHDDMMDEDDVRHGQPSVHKKWDNASAILAGDGLFVLSHLILTGLSPYVHQRFNEVTLAICEGQGMDKEFEDDASITMGNYLVKFNKKKNSILAFQSYFESNGIKKETEKVIQHYIDKAQDGLNEFPEGKRENLNQFTTMILNRTY
jgi:geranylgeranyl pyrophosphate synthase